MGHRINVPRDITLFMECVAARDGGRGRQGRSTRLLTLVKQQRVPTTPPPHTHTHTPLSTVAAVTVTQHDGWVKGQVRAMLTFPLISPSRKCLSASYIHAFIKPR